MIIVICFISLILLIWFKTDAFVDYCELFGLESNIYSNEYKLKKITDTLINYPRFLRFKYNTFLIKLISCHICLSVWLSLIGSIILLNIFLAPVICISSLIIYGVICKLFNI